MEEFSTFVREVHILLVGLSFPFDFQILLSGSGLPDACVCANREGEDHVKSSRRTSQTIGGVFYIKKHGFWNL